MAEQTEFTIMIDSRNVSNPKTINNYQNTYKRLISILKKDIQSSDVKEIIRAISTADTTASGKITLLIVATNIVESQNRENDVLKLLEYRRILNELLKSENSDRAKTQKLPNGDDLIKYTNELYENGKLREFVVNYLLINYGVRNKDLNCVITRDKRIINNTDNWLLLSDKSCEYIRYDYKTSQKYGARYTTIEDERFVIAVNNLLLKKSSVYLLSTKSGSRIGENSIGSIIKRMTYDELGEGKYFKIMLKHYGKDRFEKMISSRGTSGEVATQHYDLDFNNEFAKQKTNADLMSSFYFN